MTLAEHAEKAIRAGLSLKTACELLEKEVTRRERNRAARIVRKLVPCSICKSRRFATGPQFCESFGCKTLMKLADAILGKKAKR